MIWIVFFFYVEMTKKNSKKQQIFNFLFINQQLSGGFLDFFLPTMRNPYFWIPLYIFIIAFMLINFKKKGLMWILALACCVGLADLTSSRLIKYEVQRLRPCQELDFKDNVNLKVVCGSGYSFTSSHATNHMAIGSFIIYTSRIILGNWRWLFFLWAFLIGFAQIYVGVHFPLDVLFGFILGWIIGWLVYRLFRATSFNLAPPSPG